MGIYVHIPFCKSKCYYCGFYSVVAPGWQKAYVEALCREIALRRDYLPEKEVSTLYLGGGTPSGLEEVHLQKIVRILESAYRFIPGAERTLEVNPEDVCPEKLKVWKDSGFNRLSIGVQTFQDAALKKVNRMHSARTAVRAVEQAVDNGFGNISIDLILGLPGNSLRETEADLEMAARLPVTHISVYMLSIDPGSVMEKMAHKPEFMVPSDDELADDFRLACAFLKEKGFEHYEISNFARDGKYSCHNTAYWSRKPYIGFGPAAHSYDLYSRQWNISHLKSYIESLNKGILNFEREKLTDIDKYNEYVMTALRTQWGADLGVLCREFAPYWEKQQQKIENYIRRGLALQKNGRLFLTEAGWLVSDAIFTDLFVVQVK